MKRRQRKSNRRTRRTGDVSKGNRLARTSYLRNQSAQQITTLALPYKTSKISLSGSSTFTFSNDVNDPADILDGGGSTIIAKFQEWRIVKIKLEFTPLSSTGGSSVFFLAEQEASVTITSAWKDYSYRIFRNTNASSGRYLLSWKPADYTALSFHPTNTSAAEPLVNIYGYTNLADLGTPSSTTDLWLITGTITVEARGLSS